MAKDNIFFTSRGFDTKQERETTATKHSDISVLLPPTALGELPRFFELDPIRFQGLCRDLCQVEPEFTTADVFGKEGQRQFGVDIIAYRRDGHGIGVGQCKCIRPDSLTPTLIQAASKDFLDYLEYWKERGVRKFILFVAPDTSRTEIQNEFIRQRKRFKKIRIDYELWGEAAIANKLRPRPGITRTYLTEHWEETLCGMAVSGFPQKSVVVNSILSTQIETLARDVSDAADNEVDVLRSAWRRGKRTEPVAGIARLRDPDRWQVFSPSLKAKILRFEAQLALEADGIPRAKKLAAEAGSLDPGANLRLLALIARAEGHPDRALELIEKTGDIESVILRAGLLMEGGRISEALSVLDQAADQVEAPRLRALGFALQKDLARARLEAQEAYKLAPAWHATLFTRVIVNYLSGLSSAVLPECIPQWPEPLDWRFIKVDDESRAFFRSAADTIEQIEREAETNPNDRRVYEAWHLACLANDPERRDEATSYCRDVLTRDPANYRVLAWALARRLDVDLAEPVRVLKDRVANSQATAPEVIALLVWLLRSREVPSAKKLLENARPLFVESGDDEAWRFWMIQIAAAAGEVPAWSDEAGREAEGAETILLSLRARASASGNWELLIAELRTRSDNGDGRAAFELCSTLASLKRWNDAVPVVRILVEMVGTAEALSLACVTLYKGKYYDDCLRLLDANRKVFPHSELPNEMQRLRVAAQRELGLLPAAMATAEDLFRCEPSKDNFLALADVYFEKGDFAALAILARGHEQFEGLGNTDLLRLSIRAIDEDRSIATELWRRASSNGFVDADVSFALTLGYKLGLDRELRSLVKRLSAMAERPEGHVKRMDLDQIREFLLTRQNDVARVYRMYRAGDIPVHLVAQHMNRPLVFWYHRAFIINEASGRSAIGPTLVRHGWRIGMSVRFDSEGSIRLHADLTALLFASHLDILDKIEAAFRPIFLPHRTMIALAVMREEMRPVQPARREAIRNVNELISRSSIRVVDVSPIAEPITRIPGIDAQTARILLEARSQGWLFADFLPLNVSNDRPSQPLPNDYESMLRTPHCIVEELGQLGEISVEQRTTALVALGPEHGHPVNRDIARDAAILCSASVLELLASCGVLKEAARSFALRLCREEFDMFVVNELASFLAAEEDAIWLTGIIDRINRGIERGVYQFLPDMEHPMPSVDAADVSPAFKCLLDLSRFTPVAGDVIWADDRWMTGFAQRGGVPIVDTYDLCHLLREKKTISDNELLQLSYRLRNCDARFFSLNLNEIKEYVRNAELRDNQLIETRELRTLRRYYANSLAQGDMLRVIPKDQSASLEWPFLHASSSAVINTIIELWKTGETREVVGPRADWVLTNLYVPDRGRAFTLAERAGDVDHRLESVSLAAFMSLAIALANPNDPTRSTRKDYFEWIYGRLIRRRFEADPILATTTLDVFKTTLDKSISNLPADKKHRYIAVLISQLLADMPDELRKKLVEDREFIGRLGTAPYPIIRFGQYQIKADKLWNAGAEAFLSKSAVSIMANGRELTVKVLEESGQRQLLVEDSEERMRYVVLAEALGILSDSRAEREAALRSIAVFLSGKGLARCLGKCPARFQSLPIGTAREVFPQAARPAGFFERVMGLDGADGRFHRYASAPWRYRTFQSQ